MTHPDQPKPQGEMPQDKWHLKNLDKRAEKHALEMVGVATDRILGGPWTRISAAKESSFKSGFYECADILLPELEAVKADYKRSTDELFKTISSLQARIKELEEDLGIKGNPGELKCSHGPYKFWGTDGCKSCESGRITLYYLEDECLTCKSAANKGGL